MPVFASPDFDNHELVAFGTDPDSGLKAIVAVHNTNLGPGLGGCRMWPYASDEDAIRDVLRLSRGMTYKNAVAGLKLGGGKAVILADEQSPKSPELFRALGRAIESLNGHYVTAEDVGITVDDMRYVEEETEYVSGLPKSGNSAGGDPSPLTALGVFLGLKAAVRARLGTESLADLKIAVQGVGHVGLNLCRLLHDAGAKLVVADVNRANLRLASEELPVTVVAPNELLYSDVDVLAPCALGNILTSVTIPHIKAKVIAGAANNQLATEQDGARLAARNILYAPDYVVNAGGIINVAHEYFGHSSEDEVRAEIGRIPERLEAIFAEATETDRPTNVVADELARRIVASGRQKSPAGP